MEQVYKIEAEKLKLYEEIRRFDINTRRREMEILLEEAMSYGDLENNAEYAAVLAEKEKLEKRIAEITHILSHAVAVEPDGTEHPYDFSDGEKKK